MKEKVLWEKFKKTGKVEDYLLYSIYKNEKKDYQKNLCQVK